MNFIVYAPINIFIKSHLVNHFMLMVFFIFTSKTKKRNLPIKRIANKSEFKIIIKNINIYFISQFHGRDVIRYVPAQFSVYFFYKIYIPWFIFIQYRLHAASLHLINYFLGQRKNIINSRF